MTNPEFLKMQKLAGVITEGQYNKQINLIENEITNNSAVQNLEKKVFDFLNDPKITALLKKELDKLSPDKKAALSKMTMQEGGGDDFSSFKSTIEKTLNKASLTEDLHDFVRGLGGYKKGQEASTMDKALGKIFSTLGVANIMSMGFLPAVTGAALDNFAGTDVLNTVATAIGDGNAAAALSVLAGLLGGGILWRLGKILQNEKVDDSTPIA